MDAQVMSLLPGDKVRMDFMSDQFGIVIGTINPHPLHPHLWLVIWRVYPIVGAPFWSHDALSPYQMVGYYVQPRSNAFRKACLLTALHSDLKAAGEMLRMETEASTQLGGHWIDRSTGRKGI